MILESRHDRKLLLKAGFTGKQIEKLFLDLNFFEIVGVDWDGAATKPAKTTWSPSTHQASNPKAGVQAAPSIEARA